MKRLFIFTIIALIATLASSAQISALFDKYDDTDDVTTVYISKNMLKMMPNRVNDDIRVRDLGSKLNCIRVLSTENRTIITKLRAEIKNLVSSEKLEVLVYTKDGGDKAAIYSKANSNGVTDYLIVAEEPGEINLVLISGTITPDQLNRITDKAPSIR